MSDLLCCLSNHIILHLFLPFPAVHAIIVNRSPGSTLLERSAFMRGAKYNVGGVMHSLLDVRSLLDVIDGFD